MIDLMIFLSIQSIIASAVLITIATLHKQQTKRNEANAREILERCQDLIKGVEKAHNNLTHAHQILDQKIESVSQRLDVSGMKR